MNVIFLAQLQNDAKAIRQREQDFNGPIHKEHTCQQTQKWILHRTPLLFFG